jgi:tetratricopeptide (TPR) repeat protein
LDRSLAIAPNNLSRVQQKLFAILCQGDLASARALVADTSRQIGPTETVAYLSGGFEWLFSAEDFSLLRRLIPAAFDDDEATWANAQALAAWHAGESDAARQYAEKAIPLLEAQAKSSPGVAYLPAALGQMLAMAGRKKDAIAQALRACEMESVEKAPLTGPQVLLVLAQTYMLAGEPDKAIDTLERLLKMPFYLTPAWLAIDTTYDSLRQNPRFQKLVAAK